MIFHTLLHHTAISVFVTPVASFSTWKTIGVKIGIGMWFAFVLTWKFWANLKMFSSTYWLQAALESSVTQLLVKWSGSWSSKSCNLNPGCLRPWKTARTILILFAQLRFVIYCGMSCRKVGLLIRPPCRSPSNTGFVFRMWTNRTVESRQVSVAIANHTIKLLIRNATKPNGIEDVNKLHSSEGFVATVCLKLSRFLAKDKLTFGYSIKEVFEDYHDDVVNFYARYIP